VLFPAILPTGLNGVIPVSRLRCLHRLGFNRLIGCSRPPPGTIPAVQ
jgi:hypothetical protein